MLGKVPPAVGSNIAPKPWTSDVTMSSALTHNSGLTAASANAFTTRSRFHADIDVRQSLGRAYKRPNFECCKSKMEPVGPTLSMRHLVVSLATFERMREDLLPSRRLGVSG